MRRELVGSLVCPCCLQALRLQCSNDAGDVTEGTLASPCGKTYPIVRGIPRFVPGAASRTAQSFALQWTTFDVARDQEDAAIFRAKTGLAPDAIAGRRVLDAGCGGGRYARVAALAGAELFAVDLSGAVERAAELLSDFPNAHVIQADLTRLPFPEACFDAMYSVGVLHHTPDTRASLRAVTTRLAPGGTFAVWLYKKWRPALELINSAQRAVTTRLPLATMLRAAKALAPVGEAKRRLQESDSHFARKLGVLLNAMSIGVSMHPVTVQRICDTFDWYTPEYQWHHTDEEVRQWLEEDGFVAIENLSQKPDYFYHAGQGEGVNFKAVRARNAT